jgi:uncharacterized phosphosugar-binding protein
MSAKSYFAAAISALERVAKEQEEAVQRAAGILVETILGGRSLFSFGASHSFMLTEELVYRTGGLMLINPIYPHAMNLSVRPLTATSRFERIPGFGRELLQASPAREGDALVLTSTSGRNAVIIDMALAAREKGISVVGITSLAYTSAVSSRHSSGKKLVDLCDVVLDNGAPLGDAAIEIPGFSQPVGPLSSVTGCAIVNAIVAEVVAHLVARGEEPPVFMSANRDGGDEYNARLLERFGDRIHYLD